MFTVIVLFSVSAALILPLPWEYKIPTMEEMEQTVWLYFSWNFRKKDNVGKVDVTEKFWNGVPVDSMSADLAKLADVSSTLSSKLPAVGTAKGNFIMSAFRQAQS